MGPGREAATVRQLVLVVVLVGAAFLGGAFVNGPGLRWAQTQVLGSLGLDEEGEIAKVDLKGGTGPEGAGEKPGPGQAVRGPVAPMPQVVADAGDSKVDASDRRPIRRGSGEGEEASRTPALSPRPGAEDSRRPGARPTGAVAGPARAPRDTGVTRASAAPSSSPLTAAPAPASAGREARPALMDSLASLMPAPAPAPPDGLTPAAPAPAPLRPRPAPGSEAPGDGDWTTLARKMQGLGISRFTIEGQPGGRVLFSCLIPLAGRQAVTQRFEAEGADAVQAARAALRRVALWRAAQPQQAR